MKLLEYKEETINRGYILRCKGVHPYEEIVDFLICESTNIDIESYMLIVSSGYKAGLKYSQLPKESIPNGVRMGLSTNWLIENWSKWGYFDCKIEDVYLLENTVPS
ncbi:Imm45 family immunity protein [Tenacibaculum maritimum]|uniref:Immunity protein 45 domain-containing protein n=1 Tax=Tenacibaculum maritimum NCIMB 2154 TaxID=1349785 RepID=A0A2H1ECW4_9FLAO|nr:Imm45 family immunity protein [Tenacibaculum maritimum]MCD9562552.1 immunity 45 family protein [Tenacibaculum maritimum]MCD9565980.1 immunity 45 family protein [Tenacibaculum maritimum]MCD9577723.1 immunity 45 family protein [Tenacibaculum maritimum]MCD9586006.1 immunity 45 family protein [Tenacibaculum maritimum]MCD9596720.1 immunity 45 family protein [Tenacibaculum maritimum]